MRGMHRVRRHPASLASLLGSATIAAYVLCAGSPTAEGLTYLGAALGGFAALTIGLRRRLSRLGATWQAFVAAVAMFAAGDVIWAMEEVTRVKLPWADVSDVLYLGSYPLFAAALIGFSASRREPVETVLRQLADAGLLFIAAFSAVWFLLLDPIVDGRRLPGGELALTLAYPTLDLVLLALVFRFAFTSGPWPISYRLLTAAFFAMFVGDITWRLGLANGTYDVSSWINVLFMAGYVLWGAAALHPSIATIDDFGFAARDASHRSAWRRLAVVGLASGVPPVVLMLGRNHLDDRSDILVFAAVLVLLPLLSLVRVADMLRSLHRLLAEISVLANHDPLTGLPNRRRFEADLAAAAAAIDGHPTHLALFDIDDFKSLNDTGGHGLGDEILRELSLLIRRSVGDEGSLARLSGDEFALILRDVDASGASRLVESVLDVAREFRLETDGVVFDVSLSAGIYAFRSGDSPELALRRVDEALYRAKASGKNRAEVWAAHTVGVIGTARAWSPRIKDALREDRLELYLQPIVALSDESPVFHEALCRLRQENGAVIPASEWIEHAERIGLMPAIDLRMIEKAEQLLSVAPRLRVLVNVSPSSFGDAAVLHRFGIALERVPRGSLGIEVTEHTALRDLGLAAETLSRFQADGALVAIDDFGLGFTSFTELATLPCDLVKIPGSFTNDPEGDSTAAIAGAIAGLAHHFGKAVVIEGVETAATARRAKLIGIEYAQGWHYGVPASPADAALRDLASLS